MSKKTKTTVAGFLVLFGATAAFRGSQNMALTTVGLFIKDQLHLGASSIGIIGTIAGIAMVITTFLVSAKIKLHNLERSVTFAALLLLAGMVIIAASNSFIVTAIAILLIGVAGGLGLPGLTGATQQMARGTNVGGERALALYTLTLSASLAVAPLLEALILNLVHQNLRWPFLLFAVFPAIAMVLMLTQHRSVPEQPTKPENRMHKPKVKPLSLIPVRKALAAQLMYAVPFTALTVFGAAMARVQTHATPAEAQLAFTAFFAVSFASRGLVAIKAPIKHKGIAYLLSGVATVLGLILIASSSNFGPFVVAMAILGVPHGVIFPVALAQISDSLEPALLPRANSFLIGASNIVSVAAPPILGQIAAATSYKVMTVSVLIPVLALFAWNISLLLRNREQIRVAIGD
jgi:DHA1 family multidrug resistance protein-like MFS transporter